MHILPFPHYRLVHPLYRPIPFPSLLDTEPRSTYYQTVSFHFIHVAVGTQNGDRGETSQVTRQGTFQILYILEPVPSRLLKQASASVAPILAATGKSFGAARNKFLSEQRIHYCRNATHYHPENVLNGVMYSLSNKDRTEYAYVPRTRSRFGDRSFSVAGPRVWNSLPVSLRQPDVDFGQFKRLLI